MPIPARLALAFALCSPLAIATPALAQQHAPAFKLDKARIDKALAEMVAKQRVAGAEVLIWQGGRERYYGSAGFADREAKRPMARDTVVQIFSMTKPVTGTALMTLWEQGKFGLDDPLSNYFPEFANARFVSGKDKAGVPTYLPVSRPITVRDILRHTGGISYGWTDDPADKAFAAADPLNLDNDLQTFVHKAGGLPLVFDPGTQWRYSASVDVQAALVEKLSGQKFSDYVAQHVFAPLGMKDSGWARSADVLPRFAATYQGEANGTLSRQPDEKTRAMNFAGHRMTMGGAGIATSIDDYMRFARMLLGKGTLDGARVLKPSTVRLMSTNQLDPRIIERQFLPEKGAMGFGFDFAVRVAQPQNAKENRGTVGEFFWDGMESTLFWVDPVNEMAVVFFVQKLPYDGTLHHDIREAVYGADYLGPAGD